MSKPTYAYLRRDSDTISRTAAAVKQNPGLKTDELARHFGWKLRHTAKVLTACKDYGLIDKCRVGNAAHWYTAEAVGQARKIAAQSKRENDLANQRDRNERARDRRLEERANASGSPELRDSFVRRQARATDPLPFVCRGASSVFTWRPAA